MTEMDLKLYEFVSKLRKMANKLDDVGNGESRNASQLYYGKAEGYREVAEMIEKQFRDRL